ncbi:MAG: galactokinase [FCB group bacterium]|jgi:galactokinase|nr:galactokinase [FCB group bacterium]
MAVDREAARAEFEARFGAAPATAVRAPGRVNIIGEHTDYNAGFVLPMAIERETLILARKRDDRLLNAYAANLNRSARVDLDSIARNAEEPWSDYLLGVADELAKLGLPLTGADVLIRGDVPVGAGLSSSASLEMATLVLFETLGGFRLEGSDAALLGQRVENEFLGLKTGIMDQFVVREAQEDHALFLDCRSLRYDAVPVGFPDAVFVISDTGVARGLAASKYNERVAECTEAVARVNATLGTAASHLRDFSAADIEAAKSAMPEVVYRRARHVVTENERTVRACALLRAGDAVALGALMDESDHSLRLDYEVTCAELDAMTELARGIPGCYGSRMTGAGFGGCSVHLVEAAKAASFVTQLREQYRARTGLTGLVVVTSPAQGAGRVY